ncbi:CRISPR-associated endonuclease Cas1 [Ornithinimicrobium kibberense]|uniref:CRISPR-associated endonuclease Cas1 n=1 Tax=Ornithinimicrobium kibberense TaxID=282060 RepID=UPI0036147943
MHDVLVPIVDPVLGPASYAYRPGLGVADAVQELARHRDEGFRWVALTDIDDCFPSSPVAVSRRRLGALVDDGQLLDVVDLLLDRKVQRPGGGRGVVRGLAQGCALSPLLSNLILVEVDQAVLAAGFSVVRYADNVAIAVSDRGEGMEALRHTSRALERMGMKLGSEDTAIMSFEEGFSFLGEDFGLRYPPVLSEAGVEEPEHKVVYVATQGARVRVAAGRLLVESAQDVDLLSVPTSRVSRIVLFGGVGLSAGARSWALTNGVDVVLASRRGSYLGSLQAAGVTRVERVRAQLAAQGSQDAVALGRAIVEAKIRKQAVVLQRFGRRAHRDDVPAAVSQLQRSLRLLPETSSAQEIMGVEGAAAAAYFPAFGSLFPADLMFEHRSRQPPMDVANAALSFLYVVLLGECVSAVAAAGLDPAIGLLHSDDGNRPSLALDLLEEFRPLIVDQVVLEAARHRRLTPGHAHRETGRTGILLTRAGREEMLSGYERRMLRMTRGALPGFSGTWRCHLYRQAQRLAASISDPDVAWTGLSWR